MTNARWFIAAVLLALTLTGTNRATAQVTVKAEDLIGVWEVVSAKDLKTGDAVPGLFDANTARQWIQFTRSHWTVLAMQRGRSVVSPTDFAQLSPEEKVKTNYARVWNEKNQQIFAARGGTYRLDGDKLHKKPAIALAPAIIDVDYVLKIIRLDKSTMFIQREWDILNSTTTIEATYRRIE
jgi:hypothetical protein